MIRKLLFLRTNRLWRGVSDFMHTALFFELLRQGAQEVVTFWAVIWGFVAEHGTLVVLLLSMVLMSLPGYSEALEAFYKERVKKGAAKAKQLRDKNGRFVASRRNGGGSLGRGKSKKSKGSRA